MRLDLLAELNAERAARRAAILLTDVESGDQRLVREAEIGPVDGLYARLIREGRSGAVEEAGKRLFATVHVPAAKLVIIGAVHISQALAPMARLLGYDTVIVDPRTAFATAERFPDVALIAEWPDVALPRIHLDRWTALCALTHDPKIDDPALVEALRAGCFYVGALGSKKTHARRTERLTAAGLSEAAIGRIAAPIGLAIGAQSPAEIAIAVLAQLTAARRLEAQRP